MKKFCDEHSPVVLVDDCSLIAEELATRRPCWPILKFPRIAGEAERSLELKDCTYAKTKEKLQPRVPLGGGQSLDQQRSPAQSGGRGIGGSGQLATSLAQQGTR
jgi:hypothetical protein